MLRTIVGKRGKGKTTLAKNFINDSLAERVYILDFLGEYWSFQSERVIVFRDVGVYGFCSMVWEASSPAFQTLVIFDEIDLYGKNNPYISFLYRYGRHKGLEIVAVSRRFYDLPVIVRALTDEFYLFQITEERDLAYLRRMIPENSILRLMSLKNFEYINIVL